MELLNTCARRFHSIIVVSDTAYTGIKIITDDWKTTTCGGIFLSGVHCSTDKGNNDSCYLSITGS